MSVDYQTRQGIVYRRAHGASQESGVVEESIRGNEEEPLKRELQAFVQSVQSGISSGVSGEEGLAAMELAQKIIASIHKTGAPERLTQGAGVSF